MAVLLPTVLAGTSYPTSDPISGVWNSSGGAFLVQNAAVFYELQFGKQGQGAWTTEAEIQPGGGTIPAGVSGIRFRNVSATQAATVSAVIAPRDQPYLVPSFSLAAGASLITGIVASTGAITAGTGFTVVRNGAGDYTVTFTTTFTAAPIVLVELLQGAVGAGAFALTGPAGAGSSPTGSAFRVITSAGTDQPFNFAAQAVQ